MTAGVEAEWPAGDKNNPQSIGLTVAEPNNWDLIVVIEGRKRSGDDGRCLLVRVRLCGDLVQTAAPEAVLACPLIALQANKSECL